MKVPTSNEGVSKLSTSSFDEVLYFEAKIENFQVICLEAGPEAAPEAGPEEASQAEEAPEPAPEPEKEDPKV